MSSLDQATAGVLAALFLGNIGAIISAYLSIRDRLTRIETKQYSAEKRHDRDIDGLAALIGTVRAKAKGREF